MEDLVERYIEARSAQRVVGAELDKMLSPNAVEQTAKRLGFWDRGAIVADLVQDADVLRDAARFDYFAGGMNAVQRLAARRPFAVGTPEARVLEAMPAARFTIVRVDEVIPGVGAHVFDVCFQRELFLSDIRLSTHGAVDLLIATRLFDLDDLVMTTGVGIPFHDEVGSILAEESAEFPYALTMSAKERSHLAAEITHLALLDEEDALRFMVEDLRRRAAAKARPARVSGRKAGGRS